jgi:hypothetical protein
MHKFDGNRTLVNGGSNALHRTVTRVSATRTPVTFGRENQEATFNLKPLTGKAADAPEIWAAIPLRTRSVKAQTRAERELGKESRLRIFSLFFRLAVCYQPFSLQAAVRKICQHTF